LPNKIYLKEKDMETQLNWKKGIFKETYEIYSAGILVGTLKENIWKQTAYGELNGRKVIFKTIGFFRQETQIIDPSTNMQVGKITYNSWMTKATIEYTNRVASWKYDNAWNTKWSISDPEGVLIQYQGSCSKGIINSQTQDDLLILSGLFVTNYYWQITIAVMVAVLIPILASTH
jgi:hypothetical protein